MHKVLIVVMVASTWAFAGNHDGAFADRPAGGHVGATPVLTKLGIKPRELCEDMTAHIEECLSLKGPPRGLALMGKCFHAPFHPDFFKRVAAGAYPDDATKKRLQTAVDRMKTWTLPAGTGAPASEGMPTMTKLGIKPRELCEHVTAELERCLSVEGGAQGIGLLEKCFTTPFHPDFFERVAARAYPDEAPWERLQRNVKRMEQAVQSDRNCLTCHANGIYGGKSSKTADATRKFAQGFLKTMSDATHKNAASSHTYDGVREEMAKIIKTLE